MANELKTAEMLSSKTADKQDNVQSQNNPSNRDVNGVKHLANDTKTILDKKPTANGDIKPPSSLPELKKEKSALKTPTKKISPKSPEIGSANSLGDKKKVPMNKVQVGAAPSPNLKVVRSKIGSLENSTHKPGGGRVKIENRKLEWKVQPKIEAKNDKYAPSGGDKKITQVKLQWSAKSKIGSLDNATHKPGGGDKKIESVKLDFKDKAKSKVGSKDNIKHVPGGGTVKKTTDVDAKSTSSNIEDQKIDIKAQSKVGSLDNVKHKPGGGDKKIFDDKEYLKQTALTNESSKANSVTTSGSQAPEDSQICSRDSQQKEKQPVPASVTPKKPNNLGKDQAKSKHEPTYENSTNGKKSQPSTPKKTLRAENKSASSTGTSNKTAPLEKPTQKLDTKTDQKPKPDSMPQIKPELKKIPSVEKIKTDVNIKSKVPVSQPKELVKMPSKEKIIFKDSKIPTQQMQKPILEPISKSTENKLQDRKASDRGSSAEKETKLNNKEITKDEKNNNVEITAMNKTNEKSIVEMQASKTESKPITEPPAEVIILKKQDSQSKIEPKSSINDEKPQASVAKKDLLPKIESKSNIDADRKPSVDTTIVKKDSVPKIEPKLNADADRKPSTDVTAIKNDSIPKIEPKLNTDADRKPSVDVIILKKDSVPKTEPKSNNDSDKEPLTDVTAIKKDSIPKIEPKSNSNINKEEEKKESDSQNTKSIDVESKSATANENLKQPNVETNTKAPIDVIILKKQDPPSKTESNTSILDAGKTAEKSKSEVKDLKSKSTDAEIKSNISNVVSTNEQKPPAEVDSKKSNSDSNDKNLNKDSSESKNQQSNLSSTEQKRSSTTSQSSFVASNNQIEKINPTENKETKVNEQVKLSDGLTSKLGSGKSRKIDSNQNDVVIQSRPSSEKSPQSEAKQTSETFSPISKSDTESKPLITNTDQKPIPESKPTNVPIHEIKSPPSSAETRNESKISANVSKNEITDTSKIVSPNPQVPSSASSTSESKK